MIEGSVSVYKSYLKTGYRNMLRDWKFSALNLLGLSVGLGVFISVLLIVKHELSFDQFHSKGDRIFEVIQHFTNAEGDDPEIFTSLNLSAALREEMPIVENAVTIHAAASTWATVNGNRFFEEDGIVAGPQFFQLFDFQLIHGVKEKVLAGKRSIVISEKLAKKFFGKSNGVIGEIIKLERYGSFTVTGVLEDVPSNSFIQFDFIITQDYDVFFETVAPWFPDYFNSWSGDPAATFVLLKEAKDASLFPASAQQLLEKYLKKEKVNPHYLLNLRDLHFGSDGIDGRINNYIKGDKKQVNMLAGVALLILVMACFNYINITTSRSIRRSKEVGIRKSIGAQRQQLTGQFLTESFLMVFFSFILSIVWIAYLLPYLSVITGIELVLDGPAVISVLPYILVTLVLVTILAGFYPALYLVRFSAIRVLKNMTISAKGNAVLRNSLVTAQYALVMMMLAGLFVVNKQYDYFSSKKLGFDSDALVIVEVNGGGVRTNYETIRHELTQHPDIEAVTGLTRMISGYRSSVAINAIDRENADERIPMRFYGMDEFGLSTLGLELLAGSGFTGSNSKDSSTVFLNEKAAEMVGGMDVIGQSIMLEDDEGEATLTATVSGIVKNFHYRSLHDPIGPVVIGYYLNPFEGLDDIVIKIKGNNVKETLSYIEEVHNRFDENDVMTWEFMDDMIQRSYEQEAVFQQVFTIASCLAGLIALLGIVGLLAYNVASKTKEIGIRKVFGASFIQIISLQGKSLIQFLLLASLVVFPLVWWLSTQWLDEFAFRVQISAFSFAWILGAVLLLTLILIWILNYKIARSSPARSIRYE